MAAGQQQDAVGTYFGKYFLLKKLAAGGMGEIFLAKQQGPAGFEKVLVVKKILAHLTENKEFIEAFLGEARLAARMNHRNIVQVFELGEEAGNYFIAMEYVQGKSLRDVIDVCLKRKEKLPAEFCRSIVEQICDGASYAHNLTDIQGRALNLVHRDLNPQNVLISYNGDVKVIDFGIAKSEMSTVKTEAGMIKGKFVYMSPEQSLAKKLDKRSDIFAIGITLYEMLTGINPFHKSNIVLTLEGIQRFDPPPVSEYDPQYAPFDPIIAKALAKDRDRRYSDASEMQDDLRRVMLPRPPERLSQFMARLFRANLEEEAKMLMDSDSARVTGSKAPPRTTPAKPTPARAAPAHHDEQPEGGTQMLPSAPARKPATTPAKASPAPRPPAKPAPKKPAQGAGDTLLDMGAPVIPQEAAGDDDNPGATAMLKPGDVPPPPPPRRAPAKPTDTMPDAGGAEEGGENKTAFLGTAPARPERQRKAPAAPPANGAGGTNIISPEESARAQAEALAKMANKGVVRTRTRESAHPPPKKAGKGLWVVLGIGGVALVGGLVALLVVLMSEEAPQPRRRPVQTATPVEEKKAEEAPPAPAPAPAPEEKRAQEPAPAPAQEKKRKREEAAPAPEQKPPEKKAEEQKPPEKKPAPTPPPAAPAGKQVGSLTLNAGPNVPVVFGGTALPKQVGALRLPIAGGAGSIEVGDASTQFKVTLEYAVTGKTLVFKVKSEPWAIVSVDGPSRGRTPLADLKVEDKLTTVELKRPGQETGMALRLRFTPQ